MYPETLGALVATGPLLYLTRYHLLWAGAGGGA